MTDMSEALNQVMQKAWSDAEFKKQLMENPRETLAGLGVELPAGLEGVNLKVVENTADTVHLVLPAPPPTEDELSDDELDGVAGGVDGVAMAARLVAGQNRFLRHLL